MKARLLTAWQWAKAHALGLVFGVLAVFGLEVLWLRRKTRTQEDQTRILRARALDAELRGRRSQLEAAAEDNAAEIAAVEAERTRIQRATVALDRDVAAMSDEEVVRAFRDLY